LYSRPVEKYASNLKPLLKSMISPLGGPWLNPVFQSEKKATDLASNRL
jgi:hypothetical protein